MILFSAPKPSNREQTLKRGRGGLVSCTQAESNGYTCGEVHQGQLQGHEPGADNPPQDVSEIVFRAVVAAQRVCPDRSLLSLRFEMKPLPNKTSLVGCSSWLTMILTTLFEDGSNMCQESGSAGVSDGVMAPRKKHRKSDLVLSAIGSGKSQETLACVLFCLPALHNAD